MKNTLLIGLVILSLLSCHNRDYVDKEEVTIYRDQWGVPHIHGKTDKDVAYGLAWASCEDDFQTIQEQMLAIRGLLGEVKGPEGAAADFAIQFMELRKTASKRFRSDLSESLIAMIESYMDGVNTYAALHPEEVLSHKIFPLQVEDVVAGYMLGLVEISGAAEDLKKIMNGTIVNQINGNFPRGSNAIALSARKTIERETMLAINSHQPLEGWYSWYEAHLVSEEGLNILGGTFPGGVTIFHGVNENIGWAHTVNHADFSDVYKLEMHPDLPLSYKWDGHWEKLVPKSYWSWVRLLGPFKIPIRRKVYTSHLGTTFKTNHGFFAWRFVAADAVAAVEQWYLMNRASNLEEFLKSLRIQGIPCTNIVYADREDNIYYLSNGKIPLRDHSFNWKEVLPGHSSSLLWRTYWSLDSLPQVLNPAAGYVFNTNNTPFTSTGPAENPEFHARHSIMGYQNIHEENNRSLRFVELIDGLEELNYETFKKIKFDRTYPDSMAQPSVKNLEILLQLDENHFPHITDEILQLKKWNRSTDTDNKDAALFIFARKALMDSLRRNPLAQPFATAPLGAWAISDASRYLQDQFGTYRVPLSEIQRHRRGNIDLPLGGGPDVLSAIYSTKDADGRFKATSGESYILMARFRRDSLPILESVHAYGSSAKPSSPHYTDQMGMFTLQQLKPMSLSMDKVKKEAIESYHPPCRSH